MVGLQQNRQWAVSAKSNMASAMSASASSHLPIVALNQKCDNEVSLFLAVYYIQ